MAAQFDAVARISVDMKALRQASNEVTKSGGIMEKTFKNLHNVLNQVEVAEKKHAAEISRTMGVYTRVANAARAYATAIQSLAKNEANAERGAKLMASAFGQLRTALGSVKGMGDKEAARLARTLSLYEKQVAVIRQLAQAYQAMAAINQGAQRLEQAATKEKNRAAEAAKKLALEEQRIAIARQAAATAARNAALAETRVQNQLILATQRLEAARQREAAAAQRSAQSNRQAADAMRGAGNATFGLRSALTDLEGVYRQLIQGIASVGTAAVSTAIAHEAAFAQVARVTEATGSALAELRTEAAKLTAELPVGFEDLSKAMMLASQTGIATDQLIEFTRTVVNFSVTTGIATDQVTLLFGRIQTMRNIPISQMDNFASTVLALGVSSAATENEILKIGESIATVTDLFGLSTPATLGLSSALATLRVRPELSRGALTRIFRELTDSVGEGGERLRTLSKIMGQTELDLQDLLAANPDKFFMDFVRGLGQSTTEAGSLQRVLRSLNINAVRDIDTISRLANNYDVLGDHIQTAYMEFELGNKLNKQAKVILETTRQEIDNLVDSFKTFIGTVGEPFAKIVGGIASGLKTLVEYASAAPGPLKAMGVGIGILLSLGAAFAAYRLSITAAMRVTLAFNEAQARGGVGTAGPITAYRGLRDILNTYIGSALGATRATQQLTAAQAGSAASATAMRSAQASALGATAGLAASQNAAATSGQRMATAQAAVAANSSRSLAAMASASAITAGLVARQNEAAAAARRFGTAQSVVTSSLVGQRAAAANTATATRNMGVSMSGLANVTSNYNASLVGATRTQAEMARNSAVVATATTAAAGATAAATTSANAFARAGGFVTRNWLPILTVGLLLGPIVTSLGLGMSRAASAAEAAGKKAFDAAGGFSELQRAIAEDTRQGAAAGPVFQKLTASVSDLSSAQKEAAKSARDEAELLTTYSSVLGTVSTSTTAAEVAARRHGTSVDNSTAAMQDAGGKIDDYNNALKQNTFELRDNARAFIENTLRSAIMGTEIAKTTDEISALQKESSLLQNVMRTVFEPVSGGKTGMERATELLTGRMKELNAQIKENERQLAIFQAGRDRGGEKSSFEIGLENQNKALRDQVTVLSNTEAALAKIRGEMDRAAVAGLLFGDSAKKGAQDAKGGIGAVDEATEGLGDAVDALSDSAQGLADAYKSLIDPASAWKDATDKAAASVEAFTAKLVEQVTAAQNFAKNLAILGAQGYEALVEQLKAMGPEGAAAAATLVKGSEDELKKLEGVARQAGVGYQNALATTLDVVSSMSTLGTKNARALTDAIVQTLNATAAQGGDLAGARDRILAALQLINKEKIAPQIVIDLLKAEGDLAKVRAIIDAASKNGTLDAKGKATLETLLYMQSLDQLKGDVVALQNGRALDANGKAQLSAEEYRARLEELRNSVAATVLSGVLDPKGRAQLSEDQYRAAIDTLSALVLTTEQQGKLNPNGSANLDPTAFNALLNALRDRIKAMERQGAFDPDGQADVNKRMYDQKLREMEQSAWTTGSRIQTALTRTATVSVGYYYYQKNSPPKAPMLAATGGWIHGPGGPTDDKIPAMLSNGEFVVRASQARRFGALLEAINSGRVNSGVAQTLTPRLAAEQMKPLQLASADLSKAMTQTLIQRLPSRSSMQRQYVGPTASGPTINITNQYPQAEPTSITINRSLAYAATISGV